MKKGKKDKGYQPTEQDIQDILDAREWTEQQEKLFREGKPSDFPSKEEMFCLSYGIDNLSYSFSSLWNYKTFVFEDLSGTNSSLTYKKVNDWFKQGLLDYHDVKGKWRKYSVKDAVWVNIIDKLKKLGINTKEINRVKNVLYSPDKVMHTEMKLLETVFESKNLILIVNKEKADLKLVGELIQENILHDIDDSLLIVNLDKLVGETVNKLQKSKKYKKELSHVENNIVNIIRNPKVNIIEIFKNNKNIVDRYNYLIQEELNGKYIDLINKGTDFEDITIKKNGKKKKIVFRKIKKRASNK